MVNQLAETAALHPALGDYCTAAKPPPCSVQPANPPDWPMCCEPADPALPRWRMLQAWLAAARPRAFFWVAAFIDGQQFGTAEQVL